MDLSLLQALERERILEVLRRDKLLRTKEEDRIRKMKLQLQELRRKGTGGYAKAYGERTCARCHRRLGKWCNTGAVCRGCSHRICSKCRVCTGEARWNCTICYADRELKIRSGEWFLDEKTKKYPTIKDKYETVGEKLLKTYNVLSHISIVPPTPPPHSDFHFLSRSGDKSSDFSKSMEDFMFSLTSNIRKISTSLNDIGEDLLNVDSGKHLHYSTQKSLSDTEIDKSVKLYQGPSLPNLFKKRNDSDQEGSSTGAEEESSISSDNSDGKQRRNSSITECSVFEGIICTSGELELALAYHSDTSCLEITVGACRNLPYGDTRKRRCHPYVKLYVMPPKSNKLKTEVKRNTTHPVYNQLFQYQIERHMLNGKRLQASVWHSGTLHRKVFLGKVLIPLDGWKFEDKNLQRFNWYPLSPEQTDFPEEGAVDLHGGERLRRFQSSFNRQSV